MVTDNKNGELSTISLTSNSEVSFTVHHDVKIDDVLPVIGCLGCLDYFHITRSLNDKHSDITYTRIHTGDVMEDVMDSNMVTVTDYKNGDLSTIRTDTVPFLLFNMLFIFSRTEKDEHQGIEMSHRNYNE